MRLLIIGTLKGQLTTATKMAMERGARVVQANDIQSGMNTLRSQGADLVMVDWNHVSYPYLDVETPTLDAVIQRAKSKGVTRVMCDGEIIFEEGRFTRVDQVTALKALHDDLQKALSDDEVERRNLSKALLPHVRKFYSEYMDPSSHQPFYRPSSRV